MNRIITLFLSVLLLLPITADAATNWCANTNAKLCLKFEDAAGSGTIADSSTFGSSGTVDSGIGITQGVTGKYGLGADTTAGNNAKASFTGSSTDNLTSVSIVGWFYNHSLGSTGTISDSANLIAKGYRNWALSFNTTNELQFTRHFDGGTVYWRTTTGAVSTAGVWQHYASTHNGSSLSNDPIIYIDGVSQSLSELNGPPCCSAVSSDTGNAVTIFQDSLDGGETDSVYDEVMVWNGVLSSTDINNIMTEGIDGSQAVSAPNGFRTNGFITNGKL